MYLLTPVNLPQFGKEEKLLHSHLLFFLPASTAAGEKTNTFNFSSVFFKTFGQSFYFLVVVPKNIAPSYLANLVVLAAASAKVVVTVVGLDGGGKIVEEMVEVQEMDK